MKKKQEISNHIDSYNINNKRFSLVKKFIIINSFLPLEAFLAPVVVLFYLQYMHVTLWDYSNFIAAIFIMNVLLEIPLGMVSDRFGWNKSYLIGRIIYFSGLLIILIHPDKLTLIPSAILLSVGGSLASGNLESIAYDASSKSNNDKSYSPLLKTSASIGGIVSALASILGGYLASENIYYPMIVDVTLLGVGIIPAVVFLFILWPGNDIVVKNISFEEEIKNRRFEKIKSILIIPDFFIPMIASTLLFVVMRTSLNFYQPYLSIHNWSNESLGYLFSISIIFSMLISSGHKKLIKNKFVNAKYSTWFFLMLIVCGILFLFSNYNIIFFLIGFVVHQLARICLPAMTSFEQHKVIPNNYPYRTAIVSFGFLLRSLAASLGIMLSGFLVDKNVSISNTMFYLHLIVLVLFFTTYSIGMRIKNEN